MKTTILTALMILIVMVSVKAQSTTSAQKQSAMNAAYTSSNTSADEHMSLLDQLQWESEDLLFVMTPPAWSLTKLVHDKFGTKDTGENVKCSTKEKHGRKKDKVATNQI